MSVLYRLSSKGAINYLDVVANQYVVTGGADGAVRFLDLQFRVVGWFEDLDAGEVTSVSFAKSPPAKFHPSSLSQISCFILLVFLVLTSLCLFVVGFF